MVDVFPQQPPQAEQPRVLQLDLRKVPKELAPGTLLKLFFEAAERTIGSGSFGPLCVNLDSRNFKTVKELRDLNRVELQFLLRTLNLLHCYEILCTYLAFDGESAHKPAVPDGEGDDAVKRGCHQTFFGRFDFTTVFPPGWVVGAVYPILPAYLRPVPVAGGQAVYGNDGRERIGAGRGYTRHTFALLVVKTGVVVYGLMTISEKGNKFGSVVHHLAYLFAEKYALTSETTGELMTKHAVENGVYKTTITMLRNWRRLATNVPPLHF
jgi:hypothetical protein